MLFFNMYNQNKDSLLYNQGGVIILTYRPDNGERGIFFHVKDPSIVQINMIKIRGT